MRHSFLLVVLTAVVLSAGTVVQYGPVNVVNDALAYDDTLLLATGGGLVFYLPKENRFVRTEHSMENLPDIHLTALRKTEDGSLWVGTKSGWLCRRNAHGIWRSFEDFRPQRIKINRIISYGTKHLLIAHTKGISVFDLEKEQVVSTVTTPGTIGGSVQELCIAGDTLFAGVDSSLTKFYPLSTGLLTYSFRDNSIWKVVGTEKAPITGIVHTSAGVLRFTNPAVQIGSSYLYGRVEIRERIVKKDGQLDTAVNVLTRVNADGSQNSVDIPDRITRIIQHPSGDLIVTLANSYFLKNPFESVKPVKIPGFVQGEYGSVKVTKSGDLWLLGAMESKENSLDWWRGVTRFDGNEMHFYNSDTYGFGSTGDGIGFRGFCESRDGTVWLGMNGEQPKAWNPASDTWNRWVVEAQRKFTRDTLYKVDNDNDLDWQKVDGIVQDSTGLIWFALWDNDKSSGNKYRFAVFDPASGKQRFLFPRGAGSVLGNTAFHPCISVVDGRGARWFFDPSNDGLQSTSDNPDDEAVMIPGSTDPFGSSVETKNAGFYYFIKHNSVSGIKEAVSVPGSGSVLIASAAGIGIERSDAEIAQSGIQIDTNLYDEWIHDFKKPAYSIAVENVEIQQGGDFSGTAADSIVTTTFWASLSGIGIERFTLKEWIYNAGTGTLKKPVSIAMLQFSGTPVRFSVQKYEFLEEAKIAIDRERGYIWAVSPTGFARFDLGRSPSKGAPTNREIKIYPNPYSMSHHDQITAVGLSANAFIDVYTISGKLVGHFDQVNSEQFHNTGDGKIFQWKPADLAPGTYIAAVKDTESSGVSVLQKLVIIP